MRIRLTHVALLCICFTVCLQTIRGQKSVIRFKHYTTDEGLSQNMVDCILKDTRGFLWVGTWNGLNRFDGYNFSVYKQDSQDKNSISNNFIYALCEDRFGNIWAGTNGGLNVYLYAENRFVSYHTSHTAGSLASEKINALFCDPSGAIWIGTSNGLDKIAGIDQNGRFSEIQHIHPEGEKFTSQTIQSLTGDAKGNIWIGTSGGLYLLNSRNQLLGYHNDPAQPASLSDDNIQAVLIDRKEQIWVGTHNGLDRLEKDRKTFTRFFHKAANRESIAHNTVMSLTQDLNGQIIAGTLGGISIFQPNHNRFVNYSYKLNDIYGLSSDFVNSLLTDDVGNIWIGTEKGGINLYNIFQKPFEFFENEPGNNNSLSHNTINSVLDDELATWVGTAGGGLNRFDKRRSVFQHFRNDLGNPNSISSDFITSFLKDKKGNLWIGTWGGGLNCLSPGGENTGRFKVYNFAFLGNGVNNYIFISSILEGAEGKLWLGTLGGLLLFDPLTGKFEAFKAGNSSMKISEVGCIQFDRSGNLWAGTIKGLYRIHANNLGVVMASGCKADYFKNIPGDTTSLGGDYVISILCDSKGAMWFGTYGNGLNLLKDRGKSSGRVSFIKFSEQDGLCDNVVYGILEDNHRNLWLSTDNGLSKFDISHRKFHNYYKTDGLQSNQFYWTSAFKNRQGKMYFGGIKGMNSFYPDSIHDLLYPVQTRITGLKIYNQTVDVGKKYNGQVVLRESILQTSEIKLSYKSNEFSIEFSALQFYQPENVNYAYKLQGFDNQWTRVTSVRRFASYTNLKGGTYTFMVKAVDNEGQELQKPCELKIVIIPPFWVTWWFRFLLVMIIVTGLISYYRYRLYALKRQTRKLERLVEQRTVKVEKQKAELIHQASQLKETNLQLEKKKQLIEGQKEQLERQNTEIVEQRDKLIELNRKVQIANQQQLNFFTHISHEFRTPLTLILSPIEQLISDFTSDPGLKSRFGLIQKNAQRLMHLINQLMEIRKVETGKMELKASLGNVLKFTEAIGNSFATLAHQMHIKYEIRLSREVPDIYFDPGILENILYNLLSNAFKYTREDGFVTLIVELSKGRPQGKDEVVVVDNQIYKQGNFREFVKIEIQDTGIGIAPEQIREIFRRFYRINSHLSPKITGSGIGLYLTRELVKTHKGLFFVNSKSGSGTSMKLLLPLGNEYLLPEEMVDSGSADQTSGLEMQVKLLEDQLKHYPQGEKAMNREGEPVQNYGNKMITVDTEKARVLIVDDDYDLCNYLAEALQGSFLVIKAENGKKGLELANQHAPDIILSDVMMPEMDGLELCSRLKTDLHTSHIPVILLTARTETEQYVEGFETGADDYLAKPFNLRILEAKIKGLIENRKRLRKLFAGSLIPVPSEITTTRSDELFLQKAIQLVEEHIKNPDWSVEDMASGLCISRSLLHKKLTATVDQSAGDFITALKMKKAALFMHEGNMNISEIAYALGFNDPKYFSRSFKKHFGKTPSEYVQDAASGKD